MDDANVYIYIEVLYIYLCWIYIYIYIEFFKKQLSGILGGTIAGHCGEISNDYMQIQKGVIYLTLRREWKLHALENLQMTWNHEDIEIKLYRYNYSLNWEKGDF